MTPQPTIYQSILNTLQTTHDAEALMNEIDTLLSNLFTLNKDILDKTINHNLNYEIAAALKNTIQEQHLSATNHEEIKGFLESLKKEVQTCSVLSLTLALKPTPNTLNSYVSWVDMNMGQKVLLELNIDPHILGGAVIVYDGKYIDLSLRKKLSETFSKQKNNISGNINMHQNNTNIAIAAPTAITK